MSVNPAEWTIDRLARLTAAALATGTLATQPNGRIREVPDVRTIRYYTSIGLIDRPAGMRGRTALYGRRHLAQLVAIKRLQAAGLTLTEVQQRLLGANEEAVERIALLPADVSALEAEVAEGSAEAAEGAVDVSAADSPTNSALLAPVIAPEAPMRSQRFWSARPEPLSTEANSAPYTSVHSVPPLISGVRLAGDVTLLLSAASGRVPDAGERAAIAEAAGPLVELLRRLGLSEG